MRPTGYFRADVADYARTLREWCRRFEARFETEIVPALREAYPEIQGRREVDVFKRKWVYYFRYCEAGFDARASAWMPSPRSTS